MDVVIPVALGELLTEKYILTAAELNRTGRKRLARPKLCCQGIGDNVVLLRVKDVVFCDFVIEIVGW